MTAILSETDVDLARSGLEVELKMLEGLLVMQPDDYDLLLLAAQGFAGYSLMFLEDDEPQRAIFFYERARNYGLMALSQHNKKFADSDLSYRKFATLIGTLRQSDLSAVYWTTIAWAGEINLQMTSPRAIAEFPRVKVLMEWILENDPHYYYSGPLWFFGTYYAIMPPLMGGDLELSMSYFQRAFQADGERFLWGKLLFARTYAVQSMDRDLFERMLREVIEGAETTSQPAELRLLNSVAARKATYLLTNIDEYF